MPKIKLRLVFTLKSQQGPNENDLRRENLSLDTNISATGRTSNCVALNVLQFGSSLYPRREKYPFAQAERPTACSDG